MITTTIEQSEHLLGLGLNPDTADMWWTIVQPLKQESGQLISNGDPYSFLSVYKGEHVALADIKDIPAWSLSALLELMPDNCCINKVDGNYEVAYLINDECGWYTCTTSLDAAYEMIVWLLKNGYVKKDN